MAGKDQVAQPSAGQIKPKSMLLPRSLAIAKAVVLSTRPVQWTKSLLVFLPLAFSLNERWSTDETGLLGELFLKALAAALIFVALSGAVYIINDIFDRQSDRAHPRKRLRPIASGQLSIKIAVTIATVLLVASFVGGFFMGTSVGVVCLVFVAVNLAYSSTLKRIIVLDVLIVSAGYLLRIVVGALAIDVPISAWLYSTIALGALFIALSKRYSELRSAGSDAAVQRSVLSQYNETLLKPLIYLSSAAALIAYTLYSFTASNVPDNYTMALTVPFVMFGVLRYLHLVNNTYDAESPELVIIKDKPMIANVLLWAAVSMAILAINR